jgi:ankyrin repeat protein
MTGLVMALKAGHVEVAQLLLERGASIVSTTQASLPRAP